MDTPATTSQTQLPSAQDILSNPKKLNIGDDGVVSEAEQMTGSFGATAEAPVEKPVEPPKPPEPPPPEKKEDFLSPKFAMLAKQQKQLQDMQRKLQEEKNSPEFKEFMEFKKLKESKDYLGALEKMGGSYDQLTESVLSGKGPKSATEREYEEKISSIEKKLKEKEEKEERDKIHNQINAFKMSIKEECLKKPDEYELINLDEAYDLVYNVIELHHTNTGQVISHTEAANKVEAYLEKKSEKYKSSKKIKNIFGVTEPGNTQSPKIESEQTLKPTTTLSNSASAGVTESNDDDWRNTSALLNKASKILSR